MQGKTTSSTLFVLKWIKLLWGNVLLLVLRLVDLNVVEISFLFHFKVKIPQTKNYVQKLNYPQVN